MEIGVVNPQVPAAAASTPEPDRNRLAVQREVIQAVKALNASQMFGEQNELTFVIDRETRQTVMRVVDRDTHTVVFQFPSEIALQLAKELRELES